ncbi:MAG: HAD-IIB family hydrolase [Pseudomonadota bacterium]
MTRYETFDTHALAAKALVLATDLDGTFLGGTESERATFYNWIQRRRTNIGLIFVTGRDPDFIHHLVQHEGIPCPDYVVADVGTTIAHVQPDAKLVPIISLEKEIARRWNNANESVRVALRQIDGLTLQPTRFRYRISYDMDAARFDDAALRIVADLGLDAVISDNRYFDVLPKGVSKGPSLARLLDFLGIQQSKTLVAGDTLNDLSMLELGVPAVAVGGSESALLARVASLGHVHCASGIGVAGISEAIAAHKLYKGK